LCRIRYFCASFDFAQKWIYYSPNMEYLPKIINSVGLLCDIIGAVLLFKYGLPENITRTGVNYLITEEEDTDEIKKAKGYDLWARVGLILLIVGFILQLVSNFIPAVAKPIN
jgi:hypothetical protein